MPKLSNGELEFLNHSNAIEGVTDKDSLQQAILAWEFLKAQKKLTLTTLLKTHKILMLHQPLYPNEKGYFREVAVFVGGREGANWMQIRPRLKEWLERMNEGRSDSIQLHVDYEKIHPHTDGNGRTGRMYLNWYLTVKQNRPILIIRDAQKRDYYKLFNDETYHTARAKYP